MAARIAVFNHATNLVRLYQAALSSQHYIVDVYEENDAGFASVTGTPPDAIILGNVRQFGNDELTFLHRLRQHPATLPIPVIVATTGIQFAQQQGIENLYAPIYLLGKPFHINALLECVRMALQSKG